MIETTDRAYGLDNLHQVELGEPFRSLLAEAERTSRGSAAWRLRKQTELRELLCLAQLAPYRLRIQAVDFGAEHLGLTIALHVPTPLRPGPDSILTRADAAVLQIVYSMEIVRQPVPGNSVAAILAPEVWHPNVRSEKPQVLCLGTALPRGMPLREIIVLSYLSLSLQSVTMSEKDAAGVMNLSAARYFQANSSVVPLTREPFLLRSVAP